MIVCIGEAVIDMITTTIDGREAYRPIPGGCAYNTAIAIGRLGAPVAFLGRVSKNFFGEMQVKRLNENNVNTNLLIRCEQNPILSFINVEEGKNPQYAFYEEGTADRLLSPKEVPALPDDTTCIAFGSVSLAMEPIGSTIEALVKKAAAQQAAAQQAAAQQAAAQQAAAQQAAAQKVIAFDPNIRPVMIKNRDAYLRRFEKLASVSTIVKISLEDFEYLQKDPQPQVALEKLIAMGSRLAIVTMGSNGVAAMLKRNDGSAIKISVPGEKIPKIADTVGAGDTFHGAFLAWLETREGMSHNAIAGMSEETLRNALTFANKAAAYVCGQHGCEPPTMEQLK